MIFHKKFKVISKQCQVISIKNFYLLNKKQKNSIEKNILFNFKNFTFKSRSEYFCYLSSAGNYNCFYHDHKKTGTITGVYYFQLNERDSISFLTDDNQEFKYYPSEGELLFFPSYRVHKPNPPIYAQRTRYSINIDIFTEESSEELFNQDI
jgi:hypothetical protein